MRLLRTACLLPVVLTACSTTGPLVLGDRDAETVRAAIEAAWRSHILGARQKNLDAVCAMYADDIVYAIDGERPVVGAAAVRTMEERGMQTGEVASARHTIEALRVDRELAYELGIVEGEVAPHGQRPQHVVFHFVALWRRNEAGAWRMAHLVGQVEAAAGSAIQAAPHIGN